MCRVVKQSDVVEIASAVDISVRSLHSEHAVCIIATSGTHRINESLFIFYESLHFGCIVGIRLIQTSENQMFVVCCNSCGAAGETRYGGNSAILDPWGVRLADAGEQEEILTAECDFSVVKGIRNSINVFADRRPDLYNCK